MRSPTLPNRSRQKVYQEALQEGKLEAVFRLLQLGLSKEQIAEALGLTVEQVQQSAQT